jgi:chemotaxis protein CheD
MPSVIPVGMSQLKTAKSPTQLAVYGIGSCVILAMYDAVREIGGIAHIMLPDSSGMDTKKINTIKFADTAVPALIEAVLNEGALRIGLEAKIFGGSEMFPPTEDFSNNIGRENTKAVKAALRKYNIPLRSEDTGGNHGRSIEFDLSSGTVKVFIVGEEVREY